MKTIKANILSKLTVISLALLPSITHAQNLNYQTCDSARTKYRDSSKQVMKYAKESRAIMEANYKDADEKSRARIQLLNRALREVALHNPEVKKHLEALKKDPAKKAQIVPEAVLESLRKDLEKVFPYGVSMQNNRGERLLVTAPAPAVMAGPVLIVDGMMGTLIEKDNRILLNTLVNISTMTKTSDDQNFPLNQVVSKFSLLDLERGSVEMGTMKLGGREVGDMPVQSVLTEEGMEVIYSQFNLSDDELEKMLLEKLPRECKKIFADKKAQDEKFRPADPNFPLDDEPNATKSE